MTRSEGAFSSAFQKLLTHTLSHREPHLSSTPLCPGLCPHRRLQPTQRPNAFGTRSGPRPPQQRGLLSELLPETSPSGSEGVSASPQKWLGPRPLQGCSVVFGPVSREDVPWCVCPAGASFFMAPAALSFTPRDAYGSCSQSYVLRPRPPPPCPDHLIMSPVGPRNCTAAKDPSQFLLRSF